jgi:hypothetical protein
MSLTISSSALGANWLASMMVDIADARFPDKTGLIHDKTIFFITHLALTLTGVMFQVCGSMKAYQ